MNPMMDPRPIGPADCFRSLFEGIRLPVIPKRLSDSPSFRFAKKLIPLMPKTPMMATITSIPSIKWVIPNVNRGIPL